jgi:hypothetical protein
MKIIAIIAKDLLFFTIVAAIVAFGYTVLRSRCSKPVVPPNTQAQESTHVSTPIFGSQAGHTTIKIPIHRPKVDTVLPVGMKPGKPPADETIYVDIDQDITGHVVVTPETLVGHVVVLRARPAVVRFKPSLRAYIGLDSLPPGVTVGAAGDMVEVWKFSAGANVGLRQVKPVNVDAGLHVTCNLNKHIGVLVGRTWSVFNKQMNPKWMVGVSVKVIGG